MRATVFFGSLAVCRNVSVTDNNKVKGKGVPKTRTVEILGAGEGAFASLCLITFTYLVVSHFYQGTQPHLAAERCHPVRPLPPEGYCYYHLLKEGRNAKVQKAHRWWDGEVEAMEGFPLTLMHMWAACLYAHI